MKRKLFYTLVLAIIVSTSAFSQASLKIGYADVDYIFSEMPEARQVEKELEAHSKQIQNRLEAKYSDYQKRVQDYEKEAQKMLPEVREDVERELMQLQRDIQKFQQDAQGSIQRKQTELMQPIYEKVGKNIEAVAKENNFTYILSTGVGGLDVILYADQDNDISDMVLKKMGITPNAGN